MTTAARTPVVDRILQLLDHLGIQRAHVASAWNRRLLRQVRRLIGLERWPAFPTTSPDLVRHWYCYLSCWRPPQWEPLLSQLSQHFATIVLGGPYLGYMPILGGRGQASGYLRIVRTLLEEVALRPGETILDAGCGSGVLDRWLARHTRGAHAITAIDINRYLLQEAKTLVRKEECQDVITFSEGDAEALPFGENRFDVSLSFTVMEEGDADRRLAELVRVTKPGGRVAAIVRGDDCPALLTPLVRPRCRRRRPERSVQELWSEAAPMPVCIGASTQQV